MESWRDVEGLAAIVMAAGRGTRMGSRLRELVGLDTPNDVVWAEAVPRRRREGR